MCGHSSLSIVRFGISQKFGSFRSKSSELGKVCHLSYPERKPGSIAEAQTRPTKAIAARESVEKCKAPDSRAIQALLRA